MRTSAIMNNKGGVGETVTAVNLADALARKYRKRVILADCCERNISLLGICEDKGIPVLYSEPDVLDMLSVRPDTKGLAVMLNRKAYIICDSNLPLETLRWVIAYELGHILLGHLSFRGSCRKLPVWMEAEANNFAAALISKINLYNKARKGRRGPT